MKKKNYHVYFGDIRINVCFSGVMSEKADVCLVPQFGSGISLTGVSAAFIHSMARNSIIDYQEFAKDKKLEPGTAFISACQGDNYRYLAHIYILKHENPPKEQIKKDTFYSIFAGLDAALSVKAKSVVIPSVNTGSNGGLNYEESATATFNAISAFSKKNKSIKKITIALKTEYAFKTYLKALSKLI